MAETEVVSVVQKKADALQGYLDEHKISGFAKQYAGENGEVVIYRSNLEINENTIPFMILLDNSVYTLMQFQIAVGAVKEDKKEKLDVYFNDLNNRYRMLKFTDDEAGNVLLSVSIPAGVPHFEPELVIAILNEVQGLMQQEYENLIKKIN